jgi:ribonuclease P protein component
LTISALQLQKITRRTDYVRLRDQGAVSVQRTLIVQALQDLEWFRAQNPLICAYGITASRRVGGAVSRNRVKRRFRALATRTLPVHGKHGMLYVIIARAQALKAPYARLVQDFERALKEVSHDQAA